MAELYEYPKEINTPELKKKYRQKMRKEGKGIKNTSTPSTAALVNNNPDTTTSTTGTFADVRRKRRKKLGLSPVEPKAICAECKKPIFISEAAVEVLGKYYHVHCTPLDALKSRVCQFCHQPFESMKRRDVVWVTPHYYHVYCRPLSWAEVVIPEGVDVSVYENLFIKRRHCHFMLGQNPDKDKWLVELNKQNTIITAYLRSNPEVAALLKYPEGENEHRDFRPIT